MCSIINRQRKQQKQSEEVLIRGFVQAIADEVTSVWNRYNVEIGPPLRLTKPHAGCRQEIQPQFLILLAFRPPRFQHLVDPCANLFCILKRPRIFDPGARCCSRSALPAPLPHGASASVSKTIPTNIIASQASRQAGTVSFPRNSSPALKTLPQESLVQSLPPPVPCWLLAQLR